VISETKLLHINVSIKLTESYIQVEDIEFLYPHEKKKKKRIYWVS